MPSSFQVIFDKVKSMLRDLEGQDISARLVYDDDANMIKIYGEGSYVKRASSGLADVQELAYTTAEHHPYWSILFHASEISKTVLEKWESQIAPDELSEMSWRCDEIKMALDRMART